MSGERAARLQEHLDGRWAPIRARARTLAADPRFRPVASSSVDDQRARVTEQMRVLAESGEPRLGFPVEFGGKDDLGASITAFEMLAMGDLSLLVKAGVQWGLFGGAVLHLGTARHHHRYLEPIMSLALPGCFAMTETGHGSDVASIQTTATYDPATGSFDLHSPVASATKDYIGNAARDGKIAAVFAQLITRGESQGVHAFLVPLRDDEGRTLPRITITDNGLKGGLNGVDNGRLRFDHVRVPRENLLNRYGDVAEDGGYSTPIANKNRRFFTMLGTLIQGRISVAGGAGSAAKVALTIAIRYGTVRRQFAAPRSGQDIATEIILMDYLAHQRRLLIPLAKTYALHFAQAELVAQLHDVFTGEPPASPLRRQLETRAAGTKALATWHATHTIQTCREACGGHGYLAANRLPSLKADTDVFTTFEGDNTVLLQLVAKELLSGYASAFGDLSSFGTARFLAEQAVEVVLERTAARAMLSRLFDAAPGRPADSDLHDRDWQLGLLAWREKHMLDAVAKRLRRAVGADDPFPIFNAAQDHMLAMATAHVERTLLEAFVRGVETCPEPADRALLERVCDLFALSAIEADRAWFLEHGQLTVRRSKALTSAVNQLCGVIRPDAVVLVDAFGVPETSVAAAAQPAPQVNS